MEREDIVKIITRCAKLYDEKLRGREFVVFFKNKENKLEHIRGHFTRSHYRHLTGVSIAGAKAKDFFYRCLNGRVKTSEILVSKDGSHVLKLQVLQRAIEQFEKARMIGFHDESRIYLQTEQLVGNVSWCLGFIHEVASSKLMSPNTLLQDDIRQCVIYPVCTITSIFRKDAKGGYTMTCNWHPEFIDEAAEVIALLESKK